MPSVVHISVLELFQSASPIFIIFERPRSINNVPVGDTLRYDTGADVNPTSDRGDVTSSVLVLLIHTPCGFTRISHFIEYELNCSIIAFHFFKLDLPNPRVGLNHIVFWASALPRTVKVSIFVDILEIPHMGWLNISKTKLGKTNKSITISGTQKDTAKLIVPSARFRRNFPSISITLEIRSNQVPPFDFILHTFKFLITIYPNGSIYPLHISHSITREGGSLCATAYQSAPLFISYYYYKFCF
uniref:Uncharacterized protein n=1 Tax=Smacoviridae sp. TaxID=2715094 RepID=A0A6M3YP17_9VIRU|nr:MAG: hypothetical protein [Smacoviridae sp.]